MSIESIFDARRLLAVSCLLVCLVTTACRQDMADQPRFDPLEENRFFKDGRAARPAVAGTIAQGQLREDEHLYTGKISGEPAAAFPFAVTRAVLERGRQRYNIYCAPCHDAAGTGRGMVVRRGYRQPSTFHIERLRQQPPGYFFDVITQGYGTMPDYAGQISARDRWAIVAYLRALQLSQNATEADVPPQELKKLEEQEE